MNLSNSHFRHRRVERAWLERQSPPAHASQPDLVEQERMREALSGLAAAAAVYIGPRTAIDVDGVWRNYVTGGD